MKLPKASPKTYTPSFDPRSCTNQTSATEIATSASNGAVEGILAAAVAYTLISMLLKFLLKSGGPKWLRLLWIFFDIAFVGGFIAVAVLTSPGGNRTSGPCHSIRGIRVEPNGSNCNLPWGTFILAIVST